MAFEKVKMSLNDFGRKIVKEQFEKFVKHAITPYAQ